MNNYWLDKKKSRESIKVSADDIPACMQISYDCKTDSTTMTVSYVPFDSAAYTYDSTTMTVSYVPFDSAAYTYGVDIANGNKDSTAGSNWVVVYEYF